MARYTGPVCRLCRRYGEKLYLKGDRCFSPKCAFNSGPTPPGRRQPAPPQGLRPRPAAAREAARPRLLRPAGAPVPRLLRRGAAQDRRHRRQPGPHRWSRGWTTSSTASASPTRASRRGSSCATATSASTTARRTSLRRRSRSATRSASRRAAPRRSTPRSLQETLKSKQAPAWLSLDMAAMKGRVIAEPTLEQARSLLRPERDRGVLLALETEVSARYRPGRNGRCPRRLQDRRVLPQEVLSGDDGCL